MCECLIHSEKEELDEIIGISVDEVIKQEIEEYNRIRDFGLLVKVMKRRVKMKDEDAEVFDS